MKRYKKVLSALLSALLVFSIVLSANPVSAKAADMEVPKSVTFTGAVGNIASFRISDIPKGTQIDAASIKSSNTSVAALYNVYDSVYSTDVTWEGKGYAEIYYEVKGFGTAKFSYKIGSKKYTTKVTVKKGSGDASSNYVNPLSKLTISGVNSGKNIASKLKKYNYVENLKLASTQKNAKVTAKAKKGWKITSITIYDYYADGSHNIQQYSLNDTSVTFDRLVFEKTSGVSHEVSLSLQKGENGEKSEYVWINFR
ncbi:MAG: hypothetical protein ILP10_03660 [Lachnospiraceae bacterium]|nr:hypothetical protein [Lachnospiraceae bacterium]